MNCRTFRRFEIASSSLCCGLLAAVTLTLGACSTNSRPLPDAYASSMRNGSESAMATTQAYVEHFYPLWFTYHQARENSLVGATNHLAGPVAMSPICNYVAANNDDTLYAGAFLDLRAEPIILTIPAARVTYSILIVDAYGSILHAAIPQNTPGVNALTGPAFSRTLPGGVTRIRMPLDFAVMFFRADKFSSTGQDQTEQANAFRKALKSQPLSKFLSDPDGGSTRIVSEFLLAAPFKSMADALLEHAPLLFLEQLQTAVRAPNTPPLTPGGRALSSQFNALFADARIPRSEFRAGARKAHEAILDGYLTHTGPNNWIHFTDIGAWGDDVLARASTTEFLQFSNGVDTAAYYHAFRDRTGRALNESSEGGYVLTFPAGSLPKAKRFWSLTAYTPRTIELVPNPAHKYLVATYTPALEYKRDGSLTIYMATLAPPGVPRTNWLPVPDGPFNVLLRVYGPEQGVLEGSCTPPGIEKN